MTVLQVCAYGAEYPGNFIASLVKLERVLAKQGINTIYAFVARAADKYWCKEICQRTKVYFLPEARARILPTTYHIFRKIYSENEITITHSHFELYDIPATIMATPGTKVFWHLHDPIMRQKGLREILWRIQYGVVGRHVYLLSVADYYRKCVVQMGFPESQTDVVLNGIDLSRVEYRKTSDDMPITFLTFGWDFMRKGDDLILQACDQLAKEGYQFKLLLNGNEHTWPQLDAFLQGRMPAYLVRGNPVVDINELFAQSKVFIQASRKETFSYAVCEAAYAGLNVISSDIAGLEWAHNLPAVRFFKSEDWQSLYLAMKHYLDGEEIPESHIHKSREIIEASYSLTAWTKSIMQHYNL